MGVDEMLDSNPAIAAERSAASHRKRLAGLSLSIWIAFWCGSSSYAAIATLSAYQFGQELRADSAAVSTADTRSASLESSITAGAVTKSAEIVPAAAEPNRTNPLGDKIATLLTLSKRAGELQEEATEQDAKIQAVERELQDWLKDPEHLGGGTSFDRLFSFTTGKRNELRALRDAHDETVRKRDKVLHTLNEPRFLLAYEHIQGMRFFFLRTLLAFTPDLLTLILAIFMGIVGASLRSLREFFHETDRSTLWYVTRPIAGMISAFAVLILFKAGQLSVSAGGVGALNPFVISFVALLAGVLADESYEKLRSLGETFFGATTARPPPLRWAIHIRRVLEEKNRSAEDLSAALGIPKSKLERWFTEQEPVPEAEQRLLAAWLETPGWQLFSDVSPADRDRTPGKTGGPGEAGKGAQKNEAAHAPG
jgi:hypothetical protein